MPTSASARIQGANSTRRHREERQREAHEAVGAHLQQHRRQDHRAAGRRLDVRVRQPGVERHHRHLDRRTRARRRRRATAASSTRPPGRRAARSCRGAPAGAARRAHEVEVQQRPRALLLVVQEVEHEDRHQHQQRADHREQEELDGGVDPARPAPDPDDEVHRDQHHLPEHVELEEVQRDEGAEHARLEEEHEEDVAPSRTSSTSFHDETSTIGIRNVVSSDEEQADAVDARRSSGCPSSGSHGRYSTN